MGAKIVVGRDFSDADAQPQPPPEPAAAAKPGAAAQRLPAIAILSYEYWQRRYGRNPGVLGHAMLTSAPNSPQIVGVLAPGFELLFQPGADVERVPDVWIAERLVYNNANRNAYFLRAIGRLKPGATLERAQEEVELVASDIRRHFPIYGTGGFHYRVEPMGQFLVAEVRPAILALMGAVIFLLLIACANVANLLLVRASLRERELAVRAALGGNRWRLVRPMLAEALLLAGFGTMLGLGLAWLGIHELLVIAPANLPRLDSVRIDPAVLAFTILAGLGAAVIFGVAPALRASRPDVMHVLRASGRSVALGASLLRNGVVIAEVALSFVLLIGSGLMFRSFLALQRTRSRLRPRPPSDVQPARRTRRSRAATARRVDARDSKPAARAAGSGKRDGLDSFSARRRILDHTLGQARRAGRSQQISGGRGSVCAARLLRDAPHAAAGGPHFHRGRQRTGTQRGRHRSVARLQSVSE